MFRAISAKTASPRPARPVFLPEPAPAVFPGSVFNFQASFGRIAASAYLGLSEEDRIGFSKFLLANGVGEVVPPTQLANTISKLEALNLTLEADLSRSLECAKHLRHKSREDADALQAAEDKLLSKTNAWKAATEASANLHARLALVAGPKKHPDTCTECLETFDDRYATYSHPSRCCTVCGDCMFRWLRFTVGQSPSILKPHVTGALHCALPCYCKEGVVPHGDISLLQQVLLYPIRKHGETMVMTPQSIEKYHMDIYLARKLMSEVHMFLLSARDARLDPAPAADASGPRRYEHAALLDIQETCLTLRCPHEPCGQAFNSFDGCTLLTCQKCDTPFCGWCLVNLSGQSSSAQHEHVASCEHNPLAGTDDGIYVSSTELELWHKRMDAIKAERVCKYIGHMSRWGPTNVVQALWKHTDGEGVHKHLQSVYSMHACLAASFK